LLVRRLGFDPLTAVAMSRGSASIGACFSPIDPFQVGIAQKLAQLPPLSGGAFRTGFLVLALLLWIGGPHLPVTASAIGMIAAQTVLHVPVPSVSGQAVLTIPILVPVADLLGLSRQVTVLTYQYGAALCEILTPTNGALMAVLAAAGVPLNNWIRFAVPLWAALFGLASLAVVVGLAIGLQ
jgi:uncharacterized ion transporter superfamily protein YfcC